LGQTRSPDVITFGGPQRRGPLGLGAYSPSNHPRRGSSRGDLSLERAPFSGMLASVIGGPGSSAATIARR